MGPDMSEADVTQQINLNKIKINFPQTHWHNYWDPFTSQDEELEHTAERIFHITTEPREKNQKY